MSESPSWLCYGDYVCLSTRAGRDPRELKYILGHSSPLAQLQKSESSNSDFASIVLTENPATISCTSEPNPQTEFDLVTNSREYWFEILPRTDYDMSSQLISFKSQVREAKKRLQQLLFKQAELLKAQAQYQTADVIPSTLDVALNLGSDIHMSSRPPKDVVVSQNDGVVIELQKMEAAVVPKNVLPGTKNTVASKLAGHLAGLSIRRGSQSAAAPSDDLVQNQISIDTLKSDIVHLEKKVEDFKAKTKQENKSNSEAITRTLGEPLVYGAVIQLCHVSSKRLLTISKTQADRPVELAPFGRTGSLFYVERASTGVGGGSARIPKDKNISIRLRSFISDSQYLRMEPGNSHVPGTKFGVSLDIEFDGVFNADVCFQLGTGPVSGDNRVDWIVERCKHNPSLLENSASSKSDTANDSVDLHEVLSGCQIIRLFHRDSDSYLAAKSTKMDRGAVFLSHRSESDPSQGSGKIGNSYWMVIDGDGEVCFLPFAPRLSARSSSHNPYQMADSGENIKSESSVFLQHVVTGMVLVGIRHLPALESNNSTNDEEYLSDDEDAATVGAENEDDDKALHIAREKLSAWIQSLKTSIFDVLEFCSQKLGPSDSGYSLQSFCTEHKNQLLEEEDDAGVDISTVADVPQVSSPAAPEKKSGGLFSFIKKAGPFDQSKASTTSVVTSASEVAAPDPSDDDDDNQSSDGTPVERWLNSGQILQSSLKAADTFLSKIEDLTAETIQMKALEIEFDVQAWFNMKIHRPRVGYKYSAIQVVDYILLHHDSSPEAKDRDSQSEHSLISNRNSQAVSVVALSVNDSIVQGADSINQGSVDSDSAAENISLLMHPLRALDRLIVEFKERDNNSKRLPLGNSWSMHIMTPARLRTYRSKVDDIFKGMGQKAAPFLIACRWKFSTRHQKSTGKEEGLSNNTLFGIEVSDCQDEIFLLGSDKSNLTLRADSFSLGAMRQRNVAISSIGPVPGKGQSLDAGNQQKQFENQLYNIEFVSLKSADQIRSGAQVSSIIRNFCSHLKLILETRDPNDSHLEYYMSFLRRYHSRLTEAFDVVSRSCVVDGFNNNGKSDEIDAQGQLFFGSLSVVELAFSVIQPFTKQLGWQIDEKRPFFAEWDVRLHNSPVLHYALLAICATLNTFSKAMADEFFKRWRQRKNKNDKPWGDDEMLEACDFDKRQILEDLGFPPLANEKGVECPRVTHNFFKFFAQVHHIKGCNNWEKEYPELIIPKNYKEGGGTCVSPRKYVEALMLRCFGSKFDAKSATFIKKIADVKRFFEKAFSEQKPEDESQDAGAYKMNGLLLDALKSAMQPSDFDYYCSKHTKDAGFIVFKGVLSPKQASRIRKMVEDGEIDVDIQISAGEQMFYLNSMQSFENTFSESSHEELLKKIQDPKGCQVFELQRKIFKAGVGSVSDFDAAVARLMHDSQVNLSVVLKNVALDVDNTDSPWNSLPIFFNFKDEKLFDSIRAILIDIIRRSSMCLSRLLINCAENSKKLSSSQIFYIIKNLLPRSSSHDLNIGGLLSSILRGNFSAVDRLHTDAVFSSLLQNMNELRSSAVPQIFESLIINRDGTPDYGQQMRVLKYAFEIPYERGQVLIPRIAATYFQRKCHSLRLVFDSTYALSKLKHKPNPTDHPFAYISPPSWTKKEDEEQRAYIEPVDVLVPVSMRSGMLGSRYGKWAPVNCMELKIFAQDYDCLRDFEYFSEIKKIEDQWNLRSSQNFQADSLAKLQRELKRDWWYCSMKLHLQYICACYSLVAKLCSNRNRQAFNFFYGKQRQLKNEYWVQTWGLRPNHPLITQEGEVQNSSSTCRSCVSFGYDSFSTVATVTNVKPLNPSCGFQMQFPSRQFMYYEVSIESEPDKDSSLQVGWTIASKERNSDEPSDGNGTGDFAHSWAFDGIRSVSYATMETRVKNCEKVISDAKTELMAHIPETESILATPLENLRGSVFQNFIDSITAICNEKISTLTTESQKAVEKAIFMLRTRISTRRNAIAQMKAANRRLELAKSAKASKESSSVKLVDSGLSCFHRFSNEFDCSYAHISDEMEIELNKDTPPSYKWGKHCVIGVWFDLQSREIGIVQSEKLGGKQTLMRRSQSAFFEDLNNVQWTEADIVPCISGKGVKIKINLGVLEGKNNGFKYFDAEKLAFFPDKQTKAPALFPISEIRDGKFVTGSSHQLQNNQFVRLQFSRSSIEPKLQDDGSYSCSLHGLQHNQIVQFDGSRSMSRDVVEGQAYLVHVLDENTFNLQTFCLKERIPYRVRIDESIPNEFALTAAGNPDAIYLSDPLQLPRIFLTGKVARATWGPYGENPVDVTQLYNDLYERGLRQIGNMEAVYEGKPSERITGNLKYFFKPETVILEPIEADGVFFCGNHGLVENQFVSFGKQSTENSIVEGQAYVVKLEKGFETERFRLIKFSQDEPCFLRLFNVLDLPDAIISDSKQSKTCSLRYAACTGFAPPSKMTAREVPNYAFSNEVPVLPDYFQLSDFIFCPSLPVCFRSSCVELLRSCFIDQEPWFLTPPINTLRSTRETGDAVVAASVNVGGYKLGDLQKFKYKACKALPDIIGDYYSYHEADVNLFGDIYDAAGWDQSQMKDPRDFGGKNWDDPVRFKPLKDFLLLEYKRSSGPFELCTRDIAIFWGRASTLMWEKDLKNRFISEKNEDIKIFMKNLIECVLDTLKFQFHETWTGIISIRSRLVKDLELCALSYFKQTDIAFLVADNLKIENSAFSSALTSDHRSSSLLSCFRRSDSLSFAGISGDTLDANRQDEGRYSSSVPESIAQFVVYVDEDTIIRRLASTPPSSALHESLSNQCHVFKEYKEYTKSQQSFGYWEWPEDVKSQAYKPSPFSHDKLKMIFKQASGDLMLSLCKLLEVSWQVMIDNKITASEFLLHYCHEWHERSKRISLRNPRSAQGHIRNLESEFLKKALKDFFQLAQSNDTKLICSYTDERGMPVINAKVDWFVAIRSLVNIPNIEVLNMASKLSIQLHSFPKDLFQKIQETKIVRGQESQFLNKLEIELRTLRKLKEDIRLCFFSEVDLVDLNHIPNDVSSNLGTAWKAVERLIAQLCTQKEYQSSLAEVQSWINPRVSRIFLPCERHHPKFDRIFDVINDCDGIPAWEQSLQFIDMLQEALENVVFCKKEERNFEFVSGKSRYFVISPRMNTSDNPKFQFVWKKEMKVLTKDQLPKDSDGEKSTKADLTPVLHNYQCFICGEQGSGYCFCFASDDSTDSGGQISPDSEFPLRCIHPNCVYLYSLAGPKSVFKKNDKPPVIPQHIEDRHRNLYISCKADQETTWSNECRNLIVQELKSDVPENCYLDNDAAEAHVQSEKKKQFQLALQQMGIIDQLLEIAKISIPKKFSMEQAGAFNEKMQRRMHARRINFSFENVHATVERVAVIECLIRRIFFLLARAASDCYSIQNHLFHHIDFFFSKALEPSANDAALCIYNMIQGNYDNATAVPVNLLGSMVKVAQDGQNPDAILLLVPFLAQGDKSIPVNQRNIVDYLLPAANANTESCMFTLDSNFPVESADKATFEKWKNRLATTHIPTEKMHYGENPWDQQQQNWKHLLRVASDIVHGGYASKSEPCRSAFHIAFINTVAWCGFNNLEERQNIILRLPFVHVLHVLNTVCSVMYHRVWGDSFVKRSKLSSDQDIQEMSKTPFNKDPRLNFLNFDVILHEKDFRAHSWKNPKSVAIKMLPLHGSLKFIQCYLDFIYRIHFFSESENEDIIRRTSDGLPLVFSPEKIHGFISWISVILQNVIHVFHVIEGREIPSNSDALPGLVIDAAAPSISDVATDACEDPGVSGVGVGVSFAPSEVPPALPSPSTSSEIPKSFKDHDQEWHSANGDISVEEFEAQVFHPLISVALNRIWSGIYGLGIDFETNTMQGLKMADKTAFEARNKDEFVSKKFCRPFWRCPISHTHFTTENYCVLALAVSSILSDPVWMDWKWKSPESAKGPEPDYSKMSILEAIQMNPMGYPSKLFCPNVTHIAEGQLFILAVELLIQELHLNPGLASGQKLQTNSDFEKSDIEIRPNDVLSLLVDDFELVLSTESFLCRPEFKQHLHKSDGQTSWPHKLSKSNNARDAIVLIEKKITQWNIIRLFRTETGHIYSQLSATQAPVIRRCLSFSLVYNWGSWSGLGSEITLAQLKSVIGSVGDALRDICQITLDYFPTFTQQLFQRFESPKSGSSAALEYQKVGQHYLKLSEVLKKSQAFGIKKVCNDQKSDSHSNSPLEYLIHVGETLENAPSKWGSIEIYSKPKSKFDALQEQTTEEANEDGKAPKLSSTKHSLVSSTATSSVVLLHKEAYDKILRDKKIMETVNSTIELNLESLMYRFLAVDIGNKKQPVAPIDLHFSFFSRKELLSSTDRDSFPKYLNKMVYNILNVLSSIHMLPRGDETNRFITSCLRSVARIIYAGACVDFQEAELQFAKLARNQLVLNHERDSESFFARVGHLQECIVGLCWISKDEIEARKAASSQQQSADSLSNPMLTTEDSYKIALKSFQSIAKLASSTSPNLEIRENAMHVISCVLDNCSVAVLDRFFDPKDTLVIHSPSNFFARSLQQCLRDYETFQDRDDILSIYLQKFRNTLKTSGASVQLQAFGNLEDEFIRKLIEFETTDWLGNAEEAKLRNQTPVQPDPNIKAAYTLFCSKGYTMCLYTLRLISQMCVQSGKMSRSAYSAGQKYVINQQNSDPALVVNFSSAINSLGSVIASRMRLAQANVFDIRMLCRLFKAFNAMIFGASAADTKDLLVAETFVLLNKTVSGLSQRIDDTSAPFFPGNHPIHVLKEMLVFLLSFALSDIDNSTCKMLSKSMSWINFFNLISQVHTAAAKYTTSASANELKSHVISPEEFAKLSSQICDSAYILYSAVKRRDILKSAVLEKDWQHSQLEAVAIDAQRRVSCVEIVRTPGFAELCFFTNPENMTEVGDNTQRTLLCLEDSRQLSLRKNLVICEQLRNRKVSGSGMVASIFKVFRNIPLLLTTLINLLLLGWLNLPIDFSRAADGWTWPQDDFLWKRLVPNITSEDGSYTYEDFRDNLLPNVLPLFMEDDSPEGIAYRNGINMLFLLLSVANIFVCLINLVGWMAFQARVDVYEYLLTSAYDEFVSPSNKSKKKEKISLEDLQMSAGGSSYIMIFRIPAFWGRLVMFVCSLCILLISPLFSVLFVCDGFRFPGISYIFGAFTSKGKEFLTLGYLTASIIFINAVIGLVFFWDLFAKGDNESAASECTSLFQCTLSFLVLGWQGGGLSDLLTPAKDTPQGTPTQIGDPNSISYRLIIALFWQLLYFIAVPTCLVSTVVGIISDSFGDARQKEADWKDTMSQYCFVCGRTAADFRDAGLVAGLPAECIVSFEEHVTTEHCVKDYFKLFMGVKGGKNPDLLTAQEHFVLQKINSLDESFFPMDLSISLDAMKSFAESESSAAEKQEKRLDSFEGQLVKVEGSIEQVQGKLEEVAKDMVTKTDLETIIQHLNELKSVVRP